ncbi:MAG: hypothetical protein K8R77_05145 [Anaerolineaceae bacterium]|nr:hypothetical protein [Anaerolineaceae bacterium]
MSSFRTYLYAGLLLAVVGLGGLSLLIFFMYPTLGPRWLFFFMLTLALCGIALPAVAYLHRRFPSDPPADWDTILRQVIWVGTYGSLLSWLQLGRVLTLPMAFFLALGFILIEFLVRLRERSRWQPRE